jgi:hypothetical protein
MGASMVAFGCAGVSKTQYGVTSETTEKGVRTLLGEKGPDLSKVLTPFAKKGS